MQYILYQYHEMTTFYYTFSTIREFMIVIITCGLYLNRGMSGTASQRSPEPYGL